jgi:pimeloyl-ACP methyl ester carboxylesterase
MTGDLLAYVESGSGPTIVFIHGMTFTGHTWDPIVARLSDRFRCITVDLPGHGESQGSGADPRAVGARIHATLTAADEQDPVVVVGHSAGALIATGYATLYPTAGVVNVDQTTLVAPFAGFVQQLGPALRGPDFISAFAPFRDSIGVDRLPEPERTRVAATQHIEQSLVLDYWTGPLTTPPAVLQQEIDALLDAVRVPYLWLAGEAIPRRDRELMLAHIPTAQIEEWPGSGHMVHLAEPDRFAERVAQFVDGVTADA